MFDDDSPEDDDLPCPACGHEITKTQRCTSCDDGYHDAHDEDPINEDLGSFYPCGECHGTSICRWCPKCGADYWLAKRAKESA